MFVAYSSLRWLHVQMHALETKGISMVWSRNDASAFSLWLLGSGHGGAGRRLEHMSVFEFNASSTSCCHGFALPPPRYTSGLSET